VRLVLAVPALIVAGFALALAVMWYAQYAQTHWTPDGKWIELATFSAVTAIALARAFRRCWRHAWFWAAFLGVMLVRTGVYVRFLRQVQGPPIGLFALVTMIEVPVWAVVLYWLTKGSAP
jgi:hypothetical protein